MRGYECQRVFVCVDLRSGYESPCGVMRSSSKKPKQPAKTLRIPMRGYEKEFRVSRVNRVSVTNPHAGL